MLKKIVVCWFCLFVWFFFFAFKFHIVPKIIEHSILSHSQVFFFIHCLYNKKFLFDVIVDRGEVMKNQNLVFIRSLFSILNTLRKRSSSELISFFFILLLQLVILFYTFFFYLLHSKRCNAIVNALRPDLWQINWTIFLPSLLFINYCLRMEHQFANSSSAMVKKEWMKAILIFLFYHSFMPSDGNWSCLFLSLFMCAIFILNICE